ncbi:hypothetical protein B0H19DRAFT_1068860 [Mycena capillaripes]|nr:hypothetical protein B0H19DRAFT_1068860 [Mycena capillaripes]
MPIMLRANDATELCMTKGQEGVVCGWHASEGPAGQQVLETLFVRLVKPPREIRIADLPVNVVPLVRTVTHITCLLADDTLLSVLREQVVCLLNFGMTDYTSQGKSRPKNPVELTHCKDHRSYYVALSRGFTADGTVIVQGFSEKKITSGMSGYLRQELRELEILDEITKLRYEGRLPGSVTGLYRRRLIRSYYAWKSDHRDPAHFHPAMKWEPSMGQRVPENVTYTDWRPTVQGISKRKNRAEELGEATQRAKRTRMEQEGLKEQERISHEVADTRRDLVPRVKPLGLIWDSKDYSCGYDAIYTILGNLWAEDPARWTASFAYLSGHLGELRLLPIRAELHLHRSDSRFNIAIEVLWNRKAKLFCVHLKDWLAGYLAKGREGCPSCVSSGRRTRLRMNVTLRDVPSIMLIDINHGKLIFDEELTFNLSGTPVILKLRGIIYGGQGHFTCRLIGRDGSMWFHDGITTGSNCIQEGNIRSLDDKLVLHSCGEKRVECVIYARDE